MRGMVGASIATMKRGDNQPTPICGTIQGEGADLLNTGRLVFVRTPNDFTVVNIRNYIVSVTPSIAGCTLCSAFRTVSILYCATYKIQGKN